MLISQILFGWPAILGSLLISQVGVILGRPKWILIGAMLITGFALYLIALPPAIFKLFGFSLPLLHLAAMFLVYREVRWAAELLLLPHLAIAIYFGAVVLMQG
ncbi:hypothetical protein SPSYN_01372 [Sporotomaculum syntrophicum]|uniref:Uncharacterized protein n=1 Tax=Sporotomaculum syntrophicum TaxID=182264 RepID=A0A9D2WQU6_9FIRM|nr:hypothetical protein [Sporotomaculum syntrophicum]KAF1085236.1 hypothetical protein SPSYN_01372 [Sporotomaculum syntrophicum]